MDFSTAITAGAGVGGVGGGEGGGGAATLSGTRPVTGATTAIAAFPDGASFAAFGSALATGVGSRSADGSTHAGAVADANAGAGAGSSTTRSSSASKRLSRHGKSKPGSPKPWLPKLRLTNSA
jgi:hypothetical protein